MQAPGSLVSSISSVMNCTEVFRRLFIIIITTRFTLEAGNKQYNGCVGHHCSTQEENTLNRKIAQEVLKPDKTGDMGSLRLKNVKQQVMVKEENGYKRENTFNDALKNLLVMIDKAKPTSSVATSAPVEIYNFTSTPTGSSSTAGSENSFTATLNPTTNIASVSTPTSSPSTTMTPSTNISTATEGKPGNNITVAPGIVIAPSGEIILNPHFPVINGAGQTTAAGFPFPVSLIQGVLPAIIPSFPEAMNAQQADTSKFFGSAKLQWLRKTHDTSC